jgi:hypothetical protein
MPYKPTADFPVVTFGSDPIFIDEHTVRWYFLEALQRESPKFWLDLREVQKRGNPNELVKWIADAGVVDPWFLDVLFDTVKFWCEVGPTVQLEELEPDRLWFRYSPLEMGNSKGKIPWFAPNFRPACPSVISGGMESPEQFKLRIRCEFEEQLQEYGRYLSSISGEDCPKLKQHAEWTAMAFMGLRSPQIATEFDPYSQADQPDATVRKAVGTFSKRIGLTLPRNHSRRKGNQS